MNRIKIVIEVRGGIPEVQCATHDVEVTFIDFDADEFGFDPSDGNVCTVGDDNRAAFVFVEHVEGDSDEVCKVEDSIKPCGGEDEDTDE